MKTTTIYALVLTHIQCGDCSIPFGIPQNLYEARLADGKSFYCPNGHYIAYSDNENKRLKKEKADLLRREQALKDRVETERQWRQEEQAAAERARRSAAAFKGVATKAKQRADHGMCPVDGCRRTFADVQRHVAKKHPDYELAAGPVLVSLVKTGV